MTTCIVIYKSPQSISQWPQAVNNQACGYLFHLACIDMLVLVLKQTLYRMCEPIVSIKSFC
jgi:hypothetical protein